MRLTFTEQEIQQELNKIYLEEDDLLMDGWKEKAAITSFLV